STATATTTASASRDRSPALTACPTARISCAIWRPCPAIQTLCQPSISTATIRMVALNTSCPLPDKAPEIAPANTASTAAPPTPTAIPPAIQLPRRAMPSVAASTMPTISPASRTSRKTMSRLASNGSALLLDGGQRAGGGVGVVFVEELVGARLQRPGLHGDLAAGHD